MDLPPGRRVYVGRHAETDDNARGIPSGRMSMTGLTKNGIARSIAMQPLVAALDPPPTHIVTSALPRAGHTMELECASVPHIPRRKPDARFDEREFGHSKLEAFAQAGIPFVKEEAYEEHGACVREGLLEQWKEDGAIPLIICHSGTIRRIMDLAGNFEKAPGYKEVPNSGIIEFITPEKYRKAWQINLLSLNKKGEIERKPVIGEHAAAYARQPGELRGYLA